MGLGRASRVLLLMHDTPEYAAAIFGAMRAGFVPVLVNTLSPAELVGFYLQDSGAEAAIVHARLLRCSVTNRCATAAPAARGVRRRAARADLGLPRP